MKPRRTCWGVPADVIDTYGAVSEPVAMSMAEGALARSHADITISVTGVAGPSGGSIEKPVGTVHFGCARKGRETIHSHMLFEHMDRTQVRMKSVAHAFQLIDAML
jgi:nicotinamide-nucleotide amidase